MKVLFISSSNYDDGIPSIVINQGNSLVEEGISIDYYGIKGKGISGYLKNVPPIRKILNQKRYDIIHAHYGLSGIVALLARRKEKVVISFMGSDVIKLKQHKLEYILVNKAELSVNRFLSKHSYDFIITKSEEMTANLPHIDNKTVIPNGVNLKLFYPLGKEDSRNILHLDPIKKIILFASDSKRPEKNYSLADQAIRMIKDLDIQMIELKNIRQEQLKYYYSGADLLLMTSIHEGSPNVIKEAMACNCPIVSTDVGDVEWIIGNTEGCYLSTFEPEDVAEKIGLALCFSEDKNQTTGRDRIIEIGLDSESIARKLISVYEKILL